MQNRINDLILNLQKQEHQLSPTQKYASTVVIQLQE